MSCSANDAQAKPRPCEGEYKTWRGASVQSIVDEAEFIAFAKASSFSDDKSNPPFQGYYTFAPQVELKGYLTVSEKVWGQRPYQEIPQHYIEITSSHNSVDPDRVFGGNVSINDSEGKCILMPRFKIGWNYLVITGVQSEMAYELINTTTDDKWFLAVKKAALAD